MNLITFFIEGEPKAQPRPRAFARKFGDKWQARVYDANTAEGWKSIVAAGLKETLPPDFEPFAGAVKLHVDFYIPRPKAHFLKSGLRPNAPRYCCKRPDADNYLKAVMDALTVLGVWADDSQVAVVEATKQFADGKCGAFIEIGDLETTCKVCGKESEMPFHTCNQPQPKPETTT